MKIILGQKHCSFLLAQSTITVEAHRIATADPGSFVALESKFVRGGGKLFKVCSRNIFVGSDPGSFVVWKLKFIGARETKGKDIFLLTFSLSSKHT